MPQARTRRENDDAFNAGEVLALWTVDTMRGGYEAQGYEISVTEHINARMVIRDPRRLLVQIVLRLSCATVSDEESTSANVNETNAGSVCVFTPGA